MDNLQQILTKHLEHLKARIAEKMASRNASGRTVASLTVEVSGDAGALIGSSAFLAIERGRGPGAVPKNFSSIIEEWIIHKGLHIGKTEDELHSFAGAVAYNIMKHGTRLYQRGGEQDIYSSAIEEELADLADEVFLAFTQVINKDDDNGSK